MKLKIPESLTRVERVENLETGEKVLHLESLEITRNPESLVNRRLANEARFPRSKVTTHLSSLSCVTNKEGQNLISCTC